MQTITQFMQSDHKRLDGLFEKFRELKNESPQEAKQNFCPFRRELFVHIGWEEEILFPIFEEKTGMKDNGPTSVMRAEHIEIKDLLDRIREEIKAGNFNTGEMESILDSILRSHNDKEENLLYPWIDQSIKEEERKAIFNKIKEITPPNTCGCSH
ncbi:MAG: hemerythrin domain-containing protein [Parcubacteria group bacterium]|nr:hemerythrin domain-containing protein [Parcubacteria group bacterium]MCR4342454.1 hemerythrin domain-containing protein [Patescibacteria group bacterium]